MPRLIAKKRCKHCRCLFRPDPRNAARQRFCSKPQCRQASKAYSQRKWLAKDENKDYFRGPDHVRRVQQWREAHPGYWRSRSSDRANALQDSLNEKDQQIQDNDAILGGPALQDALSSQLCILTGLIAHLTNTALQDDIAGMVAGLRQLGRDIVFGPQPNKGGSHDPKGSHQLPTLASYAQTIQLARSAPGP